MDERDTSTGDGGETSRVAWRGAVTFEQPPHRLGRELLCRKRSAQQELSGGKLLTAALGHRVARTRI